MSANSTIDLRTQRLLRTHEVSEFLGITNQTTLGLITRGELPAIKLGRGYRVLPETLYGYVQRKQSIR